ncbi:unnamed protein product [Allacma fusca]|uniref:Uncharacterized protein n=1 Tax=Allacma fusca TaxID=39272 RepID=A0A8J2P9J3_9HEXA|nr:unnamed protein product [Allacma fusca]
MPVFTRIPCLKSEETVETRGRIFVGRRVNGHFKGFLNYASIIDLGTQDYDTDEELLKQEMFHNHDFCQLGFMVSFTTTQKQIGSYV